MISEDGLPMNIPVEYIFTVYWKNQDKKKGNDSYMSIVYTVTYVDQIDPELVSSFSDKNVDVQKTVTLDASGSKFAESKRTEGIMYRWKCPDIFQTYCDEFEGVPLLAISPQVFNTYGGVEQVDYEFTVETFSLLIGGEPTESQQVFSKSLNLRWGNVQKPIFTIIPPKQVLVTKDNEIQLRL